MALIEVAHLSESETLLTRIADRLWTHAATMFHSLLYAVFGAHAGIGAGSEVCKQGSHQ